MAEALRLRVLFARCVLWWLFGRRLRGSSGGVFLRVFTDGGCSSRLHGWRRLFVFVPVCSSRTC
ncbi:hypothetical protein BDZ89DRAFT_1082689 [Hymenopellis radicata]|nr:hypothetical protein BDZ89DRAFT_1082689 [Hymenopellis radicata]